MVDQFTGATGLDVWKIGEDIYTPGTDGDALRYMYDPAKNKDSDYYPTRYVGKSDKGGVHTNSGIANLAFYLFTVGGTHPRKKTTVRVTGVGSAVSEQIFYHANVDCMTPTTTFLSARRCTIKMAKSMGYSSVVVTNVGLAWDAVGVTDSPPSTNTITSCLKILKKKCSCPLYFRGSKCYLKWIKKRCKHGTAGRVPFTKSVMSRYRQYCLK
jgi:hypothetical protein